MKTRRAAVTDQKSLDRGLIKSSMHEIIHRTKDFLEAGADIHAENDSALRWAAENGHLEVVGLLLDRGADALADDSLALRKSVINGCCDIAMLLVAYGACLEIGIEEAKKKAGHGMLDMLNRVERSREEKVILLSEVPVPGREDHRIGM